uniref:Vomeronasal type-1 receptor n=1 Tax=Romanomermis culicivorax TaxID=13658 RepID=A0A915IA55_ROMCU
MQPDFRYTPPVNRKQVFAGCSTDAYNSSSMLCLIVNLFFAKIFYTASKQHAGFFYQLITLISDMLKNAFYFMWIINGFPKLSNKCSSILLNGNNVTTLIFSTLPLSVLGTFDSFQFLNSLIITYDRIVALKKPFQYVQRKRKFLNIKIMVVGFLICILVNSHRFIGSVTPTTAANSASTVDSLAYIVSISRVAFSALLLVIYVCFLPIMIRAYKSFLDGPQQQINIVRRERSLTVLTVFNSLVIFLCNTVSLCIQCALIWLTKGPDRDYVILMLRMSFGYLDVLLDLITGLGCLIISSEFRKALKNILKGTKTTEIAPVVVTTIAVQRKSSY